MLSDRPLKIEVLINSPGHHDQVRVRDPFLALQSLGVDCRIHEKPFRFNLCIRPHSLVVWQRPLPESWQRQIEHLQWLRERGCLLLTEWDDHPDLFPTQIRNRLVNQAMAPLRACHAIHSSSAALARELNQYNPLVLVLENATAAMPALDLNKHQTNELRLFLGNQNRNYEHRLIAPALLRWLKIDPQVKLVLVGDGELKDQLESEDITIEYHPLLNYSEYRRVLNSCQIALLPLHSNLANSCKTVIKWIEAAAESVAVIAGPELYGDVAQGINKAKTLALAEDLRDMIPLAQKLWRDLPERLSMVYSAHNLVEKQWVLSCSLTQRLNLYRALWQRRSLVDIRLMEAIGSQAQLLHQGPFCP